MGSYTPSRFLLAATVTIEKFDANQIPDSFRKFETCLSIPRVSNLTLMCLGMGFSPITVQLRSVRFSHLETPVFSSEKLSFVPVIISTPLFYGPMISQMLYHLDQSPDFLSFFFF